jgi:hypothetical protein
LFAALLASDCSASTLTPRLHFKYDASVPDSARPYLDAVLASITSTLQDVLGPPIDDQTLTVVLDPLVGAFSYQGDVGFLTITRLPNSSAPPTDPLNRDFNDNLAHELVHAHQSHSAYTAPRWFVEGFAQASADLVKNVLRERGNDILQSSTVDEAEAIRTYDSISRMGPEVLTSLYGHPGRFISYLNAEGLWWLLLLSQSSPQPTLVYGKLDFFHRVMDAVKRAGSASTDSAWYALIAGISSRPIDGTPAARWLARQAAARSVPASTLLGVYPADCLCPDASAAQAQKAIILFQSGGSPRNGDSVRVTLQSESGALISRETRPYRDYGFGFYHYTFPVLVDRLPPGRYDIWVEARVNGDTLRAGNNIVVGLRSMDAAQGLGIFRAAGNDRDSLTVRASIGLYVRKSRDAGILMDLGPWPPRDIKLSYAKQGGERSVFLPAPYTRFVDLQRLGGK